MFFLERYDAHAAALKGGACVRAPEAIIDRIDGPVAISGIESTQLRRVATFTARGRILAFGYC